MSMKRINPACLNHLFPGLALPLQLTGMEKNLDGSKWRTRVKIAD